MKNTIKIDKNTNFKPVINSENDKINEIWVTVLNVPENSGLEVFYGCDYRREYSIYPGLPFQLPEKYCSDGEMIKFRYRAKDDEEDESPFIALIGDESLYKDLVITKKSNTLLVCDGSLKPIKTDYMIELARLISGTTGAAPQYCYEDLLVLRNTMVGELLEKGIDIDANGTIEDISKAIEALGAPKAYVQIVGAVQSKGEGMYSETKGA